MTPEHAKRRIAEIRSRARVEQTRAQSHGEALRIDSSRLRAEAEVLLALSASLVEVMARQQGSATLRGRAYGDSPGQRPPS